jgi:hypothetical protein
LTKVCGKCGTEKELELFNLRKGAADGRNNICRDCTNAYKKQHYADNIDYYVAKSRKRRGSSQQFIREEKDKLFCVQCGNSHIATLDFHHIDRTTKEYSIFEMPSKGCSIETIKKEMAKCIVLCCLCHRILHYNERMGEQNGQETEDAKKA